MRNRIGRILFLCTLWFSLPFFLQAADIRAGFRLSMNTAIGTGKGYWDWYGSDADTQRYIIPSASGNIVLHIDSEQNWSIESGLGYVKNRCGLKVDGEEYTFVQPSLEIPLSLKIYFSETAARFYLKGGPSLVILTGESSFKENDGGNRLLAKSSPERKVHTGMNLGFGLEYKSSAGVWLTECGYTTFYSSPGYARSDSSTGNIRFHRFEWGLGYLFNF